MITLTEQKLVIGAMLLDSDKAAEFSATLSPEYFDIADYRQAFEDILATLANGQTADPFTVGGSDSHKTGWLMQLLNDLPSIQLADSAAEKLVANWQRMEAARQFSASANRLVDMHEDANGVIAETIRAAQSISERSTGSQARRIGEFIPAAIQRLTDIAQHGHGERDITTGFHDVDRMFQLRPGELTILAARPSIGKTAMALNMASNIVSRGIGTGFVSLEMPGHALCLRQLCSMAGCSPQDLIKTTQRLHEFQRVATVLGGMSLHVVDKGRITTGSLARACHEFVKRHGSKVVFVDYLQLIRSDRKAWSRENEVSQIVGDLKGLAIALDIPMIVLCQLNRSADGELPKLSHLRESGSIEQDADNVLLLHRESRESEEGVLFVAKQRNGSTGKVPVFYDCGCCRFSDTKKITVDDEAVQHAYRGMKREEF